MNEQFRKARNYSTSWLDWCGQYMLYDGALCVERDYNPNLPTRIVVSLESNHRIVVQNDV